MAKSRKPTPVPPPPPVPRLHAAGHGGVLHLSEDRTTGRFEIAFRVADAVTRPPAAVEALLRENGFAPVPDRNGVWDRPIDREARFQDLIDAERVVLAAADLQREAAKPARRAKGGR